MSSGDKPGDGESWGGAIVSVAVLATVMALPTLVSLYMVRRLTAAESDSGEDDRCRDKLRSLASELGRCEDDLTQLELNKYERAMMQDVVLPSMLQNTFDDVVGLQSAKQALEDCVVLPMQQPHMFEGNSLLKVPRGILLSGPPGCGKTMLASAVAKSCGVTFINVQLSSLLSKYYGESQRCVGALFGLAEKLAPSVIFIDEVDCLFPTDTVDTHEVTRRLRAQMLVLWDGLMTGKKHGRGSQVVVIGATNRAHLIDPAVLRRMPRQVHVPLPDQSGRKAMLHHLLRNTKVVHKEDVVNHVAGATKGYSNSDLKELAQGAAVIPLRESMAQQRQQRQQQQQQQPQQSDDDLHLRLRPLTLEDFRAALVLVRSSKDRRGV